jgi:hypothetical protein
MPVSREPKVMPGLLGVDSSQVIGVSLLKVFAVALEFGASLGG